MSGWRHDSLGRVMRERPVEFRFDGRTLSGFEGDTIASALLASGVRVVARSFKYHRPRGLWGMGGEEPNAIFDVTRDGVTTPNVRATTEPLEPGMALAAVNAVPDAARDRRAVLDRLSRFLPAGFYYKTFMRPNWMSWEPAIRRMAGLGRVDPLNAPPADCPQVNAHCDVLIVGAGPAGLAAARAAAARGREVWLIDDAPEIGGSLRWRGGSVEGADWSEFARDVRERVLAAGGRVLTRTTVWGAFDHGLFAAWERRGGRPDVYWRIRARRTIVAAGAIERPLWFANNDLPGVMSAEAALHHLALYGAAAGRRIVLATGGDASYPVAAALAEAGAEVTLADVREDGPAAPAGVKLLRRTRLTAARGRREVRGAVLNGEDHEADTILVSGGYTPSVHLWCQAGGKLDWDEGRDVLVPRGGTGAMAVAGAANGTFGLAASLAEGHAAAEGEGSAPQASAEDGRRLSPMRPDPDLPGRQWIDLQNDVTLGDVALAAREGFVSVEHLKRYTTLGMATDQGRTANFAGLAAMAALTGRTISETGTTTYRPPFTPVPFTVIGGRRRSELFNPLKRLPLELAHRDAGARFREYGGWLRPSVYGEGDEASLAEDEARLARQTVGLYDATPLGKIEVLGPGAAELLDFTSYMRMSLLKPGRARYGFMLTEGGIVYDDGVVLRLDEHRYVVSASSSHVAGVRLRLEDARQDRFDRARVVVHDVTAHWTTLTVSGPRAADLLIEAGIDVPELPHMGVVESVWEGRPMRIARISFTGDLSFELSVPSRHARDLHGRLDRARRTVDGRWIGLEALMILRAEKGFILVGKDTDGLTMPHDLGWSGPREKRRDEYVGKRSLFTPEARRAGRRQLVGLEVPPGAAPLLAGSHLVPADGPRRSLGFVTSSYPSPGLGRPIALALLEDGRARIGKTVSCFHAGTVRPATVTPPCAFDPEGRRLDG